MGLTFASPALLWGLTLLLGPVVAHLTGARELRRVLLPTLRFLGRSSQTVRRRTRLEGLILLLLRCLLILLLVGLVARPTLSWRATAPPGVDPSLPLVVVLDASASTAIRVAGGPVWELEKRRAEEAFAVLNPGTLGAVVTFDRVARIEGPGLTADPGAWSEMLEAASPGFGSSDLGAAIRAGRELLVEGGFDSGRILVLSDGTATALPEATPDWPAGIVVQVVDLGPDDPGNRYVDAALILPPTKRGEGPRVEVRVRGVGPEAEGPVAVTLSLEEGVDVVSDAVLTEGAGSRVFSLPASQPGNGRASASLPPDELPADDSATLSMVAERDVSVLLISGDGGISPRDDEVAFLERALQPGVGLSRIRPRRAAAEELRRIDGGAGDVVFLANVAELGPLAADLKAFVERGGGLVISVGHQVDPTRYGELLGELLPAPLAEVKVRGAATFERSLTGLAAPPLDREEFRVFRSGGASVFGRVRFGRTMGVSPQIPPGTEVLLRYTDGLPALLSRRVGEGRVMLFTSSFDDDWTDLPLRSVFVPLIHQLCRTLSGTLAVDAGPPVEVGTVVLLPVPPESSDPAWVLTPDGRLLPLDSALAGEDGRSPFAGTDRPGEYQVFWGLADRPDSERVLRQVFSVRVAAAESELRPVDEGALLAAIPGLRWQGGDGELAESAPVEVVRTADLASVLLVGLLALLLAEGAVLLRGRR